MRVKMKVNCLSALFGAILSFLFGSLDGFLITLIVFVVMDYITGVIDAIVNEELSSDVGFKGILKKVLIFAVVAVANIIDVRVIRQGSVLRTATVFFYLSNEGISILENIGNIGVPLPKKLIKVLKQLKEKDDECETDNWED